MFKIFMIIAVLLLAAGWIAYGIWIHKIREEEKKQPREASKRLQQTRSEVADYAQKLKDFKKPTRKPSDQDEPNQNKSV